MSDRPTAAASSQMLLSHVRAKYAGRAALAIDVHLWIRELTRIDRAAAGSPELPSGPTTAVAEQPTTRAAHPPPTFPPSTAGTAAAPAGACTLGAHRLATWTPTTTDIRAQATQRRPVPGPDPRPRRSGAYDAGTRTGPACASRRACAGSTCSERRISLTTARRRGRARGTVPCRCWCTPATDAGKPTRQRHLPVVPAGRRHPLPRVGDRHPCSRCRCRRCSAATNSTAAEKKALVFTDSVQDAAHRAGFIQSRSHALTLRRWFARHWRPVRQTWTRCRTG